MPPDGELLPPELFDDVLEYLQVLNSPHSGRLSERHAYLTDDHPAVSFCQDLLEQLSSKVLSRPVVGFGTQSRGRLALERRRLERRRESESLQRLVFRLEETAATLGTAGYARSEEETHEFLESDFHSLLRALVSYLDEAAADSDGADAAASVLGELEEWLGVSDGYR